MGALRFSSAALLLALTSAPYQCAREPDPNRRVEEDPAEVVYNLAERFKTDGKAEARVSTLKYLVERFPTSRFANMARADLEQLGQPAPAPTSVPAPASDP